ncbi:MAG: hypothetical protein ACLFR1_06440 [Spirochaetia bacterium]
MKNTNERIQLLTNLGYSFVFAMALVILGFNVWINPSGVPPYLSNYSVLYLLCILGIPSAIAMGTTFYLQVLKNKKKFYWMMAM